MERYPIGDREREMSRPASFGSRRDCRRQFLAHVVSIGKRLIAAVVRANHERHALNSDRYALEEFALRAAVIWIDGESDRSQVSKAVIGTLARMTLLCTQMLIEIP